MAPRNNFARLPRDVRRRIMHLRLDGLTQADICNDSEVAAALAKGGVTLHSTTFMAMERSLEYANFKRSLDETERKVAADRWAAEALRDCAGIDSIADMTQMELLRQLRELAEKGAGDPDVLLKLTTAVSRIKSTDSEDRIKRLTRQLEEVKRDAMARESDLLGQIDRLTKQNARLKELAGEVDSAAVADKMKQKLGL